MTMGQALSKYNVYFVPNLHLKISNESCKTYIKCWCEQIKKAGRNNNYEAILTLSGMARKLQKLNRFAIFELGSL